MSPDSTPATLRRRLFAAGGRSATIEDSPLTRRRRLNLSAGVGLMTPASPKLNIRPSLSQVYLPSSKSCCCLHLHTRCGYQSIIRRKKKKVVGLNPIDENDTAGPATGAEEFPWIILQAGCFQWRGRYRDYIL